VTTWEQFASDAPDMATAGRQLWQQHGLMYLATVRPDQSPRLHPVAPVLAAGQVFVAVSDRSPKWRDLAAGRRCVLHCLPGPRDDEFVLRCRPREVPDAHDLVAAAASHRIHDDDHLFAFDLDQVDHGWWEHVGEPTTFPLRWRWDPATGVRALTLRPR
jgi:hypothetical protein